MDFYKLSMKTSRLVGSPYAFLIALFITVVWALSGPFLHFSTVWQLTINTATTIITFLMVFLIQASQNSDTHAIHLKLDEILHAMESARNDFIGVERKSADEVALLAEKVEEDTAHDSQRRSK